MANQQVHETFQTLAAPQNFNIDDAMARVKDLIAKQKQKAEFRMGEQRRYFDYVDSYVEKALECLDEGSSLVSRDMGRVNCNTIYNDNLLQASLNHLEELIDAHAVLKAFENRGIKEITLNPNKDLIHQILGYAGYNPEELIKKIDPKPGEEQFTVLKNDFISLQIKRYGHRFQKELGIEASQQLPWEELKMS